MQDYQSHLAEAGDALQALADGPGRAAAETLEQAFGKAGQRIEQALSSAARRGELDFRAMAQSVLADLARIAAQAVIAGQGGGGQSNPVTVNLSMPQGDIRAMPPGARANVSKAVAQAVAKGGRYL